MTTTAAPSNGAVPAGNALQRTALAYAAQGMVVLVLPPRTKIPPGTGWQHRRLTTDQLEAILERGSHNLAVLTGPPSGGLGDVDLDTPEAAWLADHGFLPETPAAFGRPTSPRSHRLYTVPDGPDRAPPGSTRHQSRAAGPAPPVVHAELRWGPGLHTVVPGSLHKDTGEPIDWMPDPQDDGGGGYAATRPPPWDVPAPAVAGWAELTRGVGRVAAGSLLAREWPRLRRERCRHHTVNALAGGLLRSGWPVVEVVAFVEPVLRLAGDEEVPDRLAAVEATATTLAAGGSATGWRDLATYLPPQDVDRLKRWLQVGAPASDPDVVALRGAGVPPRGNGPVAGAAASGTGSPARTTPPPGRRALVELAGNDLEQLTDDTLRGVAALAGRPPRLFNHGGLLARLVRRASGADSPLGIESLTSEALLLSELVQLLDFREDDGHQRLVPVTPKSVLVRNLLAQPAKRWPIPVLARLTDTPVYTDDGRLLVADGYDPGSGVYLELAPELRGLTVPTAPTPDEGRAAVAELLDGCWRYFPFRGAADKANALAGALTPLLRAAIDGATPLHAITAATPGTGKTWLARSIARPFAGDRIGEFAPIPGAESETELVKKLTGYFKEGLPAVLVDNGDGYAPGPTLANATTRRRWRERLLGGNVISDYPIDVLWLFTGNNPAFDTATARRIVPIELRTRTEDATVRPDIPPEHQGESWLTAQRRRQVEALLTMVAWWRAQAPAPYRGPLLGGYECWSRVVGLVLQACGVPDFLANVAGARDRAAVADEVSRHFFAAWWNTFTDTEVTAEEVWSKIGPLTDIADELDLRNDPPPRALGRFLLRQRGRVYTHKRVVHGRRLHGRRQWRLADPDDSDAD